MGGAVIDLNCQKGWVLGKGRTWKLFVEGSSFSVRTKTPKMRLKRDFFRLVGRVRSFSSPARANSVKADKNNTSSDACGLRMTVSAGEAMLVSDRSFILERLGSFCPVLESARSPSAPSAPSLPLCLLLCFFSWCVRAVTS